MASYNIHIAVGKRYLEKNSNITNIKDFYLALIEPDLTNNKEYTHYTIPNHHETLISHLEKKVGLYNYLCHNKLNNDYNKGFFLHLVTDYLFFNNFIDKSYLNSISYDNFCSDLYYSYQAIDNYLLAKYQIDYSIYSRKVINKMLQTLKTNTKKNVQNIIPLPKLDNFIENVSNINIENYAKKIILNKKNILP